MNISLSMKVALDTLNSMSVDDAKNADLDDLMFIATVFRDNLPDNYMNKFLSILIAKFWEERQA